MLGVLIESRARRQRRLGGAALSVAAHLAILGALAVETMRRADASPASARPAIVRVHLAPPPPAADHAPIAHGPAPASSEPLPLPAPPRIPISSLAPASLPPVSVGAPPLPAEVAFGPGAPPVGGRPRGILDGAGGEGGADDAAPWTAGDLMMRALATSKPRYPESLRAAGVEGQVLIRFVVDTAGRIEPASVQVLSATHPLFARAVLDALGGFRFRPAVARGRRVDAVAEMPFEFAISRTGMRSGSR